MERNPLLPSFPDLLLIGGITLVVLVVVGVGLGVWLSNRSRARSESPPEEDGT